jgi:hypothetical protein
MHELFAQQKRAVRAVEDVEKPIPVRDHHDLTGDAAELQVGQHRHVVRIPIVRIVRRELVPPHERAGIGIKASRQLVKRLSPARLSPKYSGDGLPVPQ